MTIISLEHTQSDVRSLVAQVATLVTQIAALQAVVTATATANTVLAGPATGSPAAPAFRALVSADIPA